MKGKKVERVVFNEITKKAVTNGINNPREIESPLVDAYMARRALDYLVGFNISPILWTKLPGSKSAGRVQSVALRLITEREHEIELFKPEEFWTIASNFQYDDKLIQSKLSVFNEKKTENKLDLVTIATPNSTHFTITKAFLEAGFNVFCEKPMALSKRAAENMIRIADESNFIIGIGHERRYDPAIEKLKSIVNDRSFGEKMHIEANWSHDILASLDNNNWRGSSIEAPAGGMTGTGVHMTDLFLSMFGSVEGLFAQSSNRVLSFETGDLSTVQMKFKNGATGQLSVISKTPYYCRLTAFGDKMWAELRDLKHPMFKAETELSFCKIGEEPTKELFPATDIIKSNLEEWAMAIQGKSNYRFTNQEKIENVAILEAMDKSIKDRKWVKI